jgi:nuclear pore complex protein Nup205
MLTCLVHLFPVLAAYITEFGSPEGVGDLQQARQLNTIVCKQGEENSWTLANLGAAVRAWWIAEYGGWYVDDSSYDFQGINLDEEDEERTKQFMEALKEGAFDFILAVATDCKAQEWQDPSRLGMRQWLPRKSPHLASDPFPFSHFLQRSLMVHLEGFIDAAISNLPDILRKLRTEEDEQRQLSQSHEQDLDLERFLIIISHAYEGRPDAAMSFWEDPDSNLAGFLQWTSRRASTPLVSAFCEMLQCLSDNEDCATAAYTFLQDESHQSSGKMKRSQSLTWNQIFKELEYFTAKLRERPSPAQSYRPGKPGADLAEAEPESAMMLECYLRLIAKLCSESEVARQRMILDEELNVVGTLLRLATCMIPSRLRACVFYVLKALMERKQPAESDAMWRHVDMWLTGNLPTQGGSQRSQFLGQSMSSQAFMEATMSEISSNGFEEPNAFIQLLTSLVAPVDGPEGLNDSLPFPEDLGASYRIPGVETYVDFVFHILATQSKDILDASQLRVLRLSCLEFALTCLSTFNEDLIVLGNQSNIDIDAAMPTTDLATYMRLHPFARVMDWMFNEKVITALISTIHQESSGLGSAPPDSPLVLSILQGIQVMIKVLELQETYLHLVRPLIKARPRKQGASPANAAYTSFEDGILGHLSLVVDLGKYCNLGHGELTLACLKLLEKISTSSRIISAWKPESGQLGHRNKAIVQLEKNGEGEVIASSLAANLVSTIDPVAEADSESYLIKVFILDFLYECLSATPNQPTIAHLLLGFHCELNRLSIEPNGPYDQQKSLFHSLLNVLIALTVYQEERGMRGYLIVLKFKILRVLQVLWKSPLSAALVMDELRATNFMFHMLLREVQIQPDLTWDGLEATHPEFLLSDASVAYIDYLSSRAMILEYIGKELCSVSQNRIPSIKRKIFDALNGQIREAGEEPLTVPNIFDLFDFLNPEARWDVAPPEFVFFKDLDLSPCAEEHRATGLQYNIHKVKETIELKRNERRDQLQVATQEELEAIEKEEILLVEYLTFSNRKQLFSSSRLGLLKAWVNLLLVMFEASEFRGTPKMAFLLQALQAILPTLETFVALSTAEAYELARVAKVLLFKLDLSGEGEEGEDAIEGESRFNATTRSSEKERFTVGNLISDKLFQLFQICLSAIGKWSGSAELRAIYYSICYRYLTAVVDKDITAAPTHRAFTRTPTRILTTARAKTLKTIHLHGDRLLNVICDDAYGSDMTCQTAATILLSALVHVSCAPGQSTGLSPTSSDEIQLIDSLNRLNFIAILVDSLKSILTDWLSIISALFPSQTNYASTTTSTPSPTYPISIAQARALEQYTAAKLALLLQISQTRSGAKYMLQANLFHALDASGVFAADPELQVDARNLRALEKHYALLVSLVRIVAAAVLARGANNILQGRKFLLRCRALVVHTLKRSAGIGMGMGGVQPSMPIGMMTGRSSGGFGAGAGAEEEAQRLSLEERIDELAEAFMLLITATGFLEVCLLLFPSL